MFQSLDFLYVPSRHPDREIAYYTEVLGGTLLFRVIYRVENLGEAVRRLEQRGWQRGAMLEIPHGPCCVFTAEGGQRLAIYELTRPEANTHFLGLTQPTSDYE